MRSDDERHFPPGTVPGAVGALGAIAFAVLVLGAVFGWLLGSCGGPAPVQMIPNHSPAVSSTAIATSSAAATMTGMNKTSVRIPARLLAGYNRANNTPDASSRSIRPSAPAGVFSSPDGQGDEIVIEVSQAISAAATSSAQASASVSPKTSEIGLASGSRDENGRLAVIAATMPGVLAADLQLLSLDASPVTQPLVGVDLELGLDVAGNLEAGAVGATAGGKAFVGAYYWSRWNLSAQGLAAGIGLRF